MYKIAILGCENTHANSFLRQIYKKGRHTDIEVIGIYSDEEEPRRKLCEEFGVPVMERYDELVEMAYDANMNILRMWEGSISGSQFPVSKPFKGCIDTYSILSSSWKFTFLLTVTVVLYLNS